MAGFWRSAALAAVLLLPGAAVSAQGDADRVGAAAIRHVGSLLPFPEITVLARAGDAGAGRVARMIGAESAALDGAIQCAGSSCTQASDRSYVQLSGIGVEGDTATAIVTWFIPVRTRDGGRIAVRAQHLQLAREGADWNVVKMTKEERSTYRQR